MKSVSARSGNCEVSTTGHSGSAGRLLLKPSRVSAAMPTWVPNASRAIACTAANPQADITPGIPNAASNILLLFCSARWLCALLSQDSFVELADGFAIGLRGKSGGLLETSVCQLRA